MALTVAQLVLSIEAQGADKAKAAMAGVNQEAQGAPSLFAKAGAGLLGFAAGGVALSLVRQGWDMLSGAVGDFMATAADADRVNAQTAAVIKSTGGAAGITAQQVSDLSSQLADMTGIDDQAVQSAQNMLLTFTNIGQKVFPQATSSVLDLATAMNHGAIPDANALSGASIMLGKALNDPTKGISALTRVGVTFTDAQKKQIATMIKAGDVAGAQTVILQELGREFGGSAKSAGDTFAGTMAKIGVQVQNVKEAIGHFIQGAILKLYTAAKPLIDGLLAGAPGVLANITAALSPLLDGIASFVHLLATNSQAMDMAKGALIAIGVVIAAILLPQMIALAVATVTATFPFILIAAAAVALGAGFVWLYNNVKPFHDIIDKLRVLLATGFAAAMAFLGPVIKQAGEVLGKFAAEVSTQIGPLLTQFFGNIQNGLKVLEAIWKVIWPGMQQVLAGVWQFIQGYVQVAWSVISGVIKIGLALLRGDWAGAWKAMQDMLAGVWSGIQKMIGGALNIVIGYVRMWGGLLQGAWTGIWNGITGYLRGLVGSFVALGGNIIGGLLDGLKNSAGAVINWVKGLAGNIISAVKGIFGIASPSKVFHAIGGHIADGLVNGVAAGDVHKRVAAHLAGLGASVSISSSGGPASLSAVHAAHSQHTARHHGAHHSHHSSGTSSGEGQPIQLVLDNRVIARALAPYVVQAIRMAGVKLS